MRDNRGIWLAIIMLVALVVGAAGGVISWIGGMHPANAILAGSGTFAGTVFLVIAVIYFLHDAKP
jgi:hypothetical protein